MLSEPRPPRVGLCHSTHCVLLELPPRSPCWARQPRGAWLQRVCHLLFYFLPFCYNPLHPPPISAAFPQREAVLKNTWPKILGLSPNVLWLFPGNIDFAIKSWSCVIAEAWVGSHGQGAFEVVLSEHMDPFFPITRLEDKC